MAPLKTVPIVEVEDRGLELPPKTKGKTALHSQGDAQSDARGAPGSAQTALPAVQRGGPESAPTADPVAALAEALRGLSEADRERLARLLAQVGQRPGAGS